MRGMLRNKIASWMALTILFVSISVLAGPFEVIGVVTSVPAVNATPAGAVTIKGFNTIEITGRASGGSGVLHVLRKVAIDPSNFQFRPWYEDRPIDPFERQDVNGYFSGRYTIPAAANEVFVVLNPGGTVTLDATKPLYIRGVNY